MVNSDTSCKYFVDISWCQKQLIIFALYSYKQHDEQLGLGNIFVHFAVLFVAQFIHCVYQKKFTIWL